MAAALAKLNQFRHGGDRGNQHAGGKAQRCALPPTQAQTAKDFNISRRTLQHATKVAKKAPEVLASVRDGKLSAQVAADVADLPQGQRAEIVAAPEPRATAAINTRPARCNFAP